MSIKYEMGTLTTLASTALNSLASTYSDLSDAFDNGDAANLYMFGILELNLASLTPTGTPRVDAYIITSVDGGSNYVDSTDGASPIELVNHYIGSFFPRATAAAQRLTLGTQYPQGPIWLPPESFKIMLINKCGVAFASSGNTLKLLPFRYQ